MRKLHGVYLEEEILTLAQSLGMTNLSDFVRDCLMYFVSGCDRELTRSEIRELSKKFALEKRAAILKQQKITGQSEEDRAKIEEFRQNRESAIDSATRREIERITPDRFRRYLDDPHGDFQGVLEDVVSAVGRESGYPVELHDLIAAYKRVTAE